MSGTGLFDNSSKPTTNSSQQSPSVSTNVTRDEIVRVLMPELRKLVEDSVDKAIEHAMAPLLDKQRQLEVELIQLTAERQRAAPPPKPAARATEMTVRNAAADAASKPPVGAVGSNALAALNTPEVASGVQSPPLTERRTAYVVASTSGVLVDDIPSELNGARRKRIVIWAFSIVILVSLLCAIALSVASNLGRYF
jgi:hypothetical protein